MIKAFRYKIKPNKVQRELLMQFFGCTRFIYNWGLDIKVNSYKNDKKRVSYNDLAKRLTLLKQQSEYNWLAQAPNVCLQQSLRCLENAFTRFFREKKGFPKFKSKRESKDVCKFIESVHFDFNEWKVKIPKVGWVKLCRNKEIDLSEWKLGTLTVSRDNCGEYWCVITCSNAKEYPTKAKLDVDKAVGIDLGIKDFAIFSDGNKIPNPKFLEKSQRKLQHLQRFLARKQKSSKRREAARMKVAKCHRAIRNQRLDFLHKLTTSLVKSAYETFCLEDLNVQGMMQNHHLARSISSVGWKSFKAMLEYKSKNEGKNIVYIGRYEPSSKRCSTCGFKNESLTLDTREWTCPHCGTHHDRDINAAINIRNIAFDPQNLVGYKQ